MELSTEFFEEHWNFSNVVLGDVLQKWGERTTRVIDASEGRFVYKIRESNKSRSDLEKELSVLTFLERNKFDAPQLVKTKTGEVLAQSGDQCVQVMRFIDGEAPVPNAVTFGALGHLTGTLHSLKSYPHKCSFDYQVIIKEHFNDRAHCIKDTKGYLALAKTLPSFDGLPEVLTHTDIAPSNSLQRADGSIVLIDWDDAGLAPAVFDAGFPLIQQFISEDCIFDRASAFAFYSSYFQVHSMSVAEKGLIFDAALFRAMDYVVYHEPEKRWKRIQWALEHKDEIVAVYS